MADTTAEDFLDAPEPAPPAYAEETLAAGPARRGLATWMSTGAWLLAGLVIGALVVAMLHTSSSTNANGVPSAPTANQAFGGRFGGGLPGEQRVIGTLTAVGSSSVTVKSASGASTYPIESGTLLVKDGRRVSSTSSMKPGDQVVVHVYPQNGSTHTEMVIDGIPSGRGFGGNDDRGGPDDNTTGNDGTTTET